MKRIYRKAVQLCPTYNIYVFIIIIPIIIFIIIIVVIIINRNSCDPTERV
jgi:uncharacterized integral membrane protein